MFKSAYVSEIIYIHRDPNDGIHRIPFYVAE